MAGNRNARINEEIMKCLAEILPTVKDPRLQGCMLSVLRCETPPDLCKVFISVLGQYNEKELKQGFKSVSGFIRRQLAQMLTVRYTPELVFVIDDSISYGAHISKLLNDLDIKHDDDESEEAEDEDLF